MGGAGVPLVVGGRGESLGDTGEVDDGIGAIESAIEALAGDEIAGSGFNTGREATRSGSRAEKAAGRLTARGKRIEKVASHEAGSASDEDHWEALRKATSPK
jgi:hypothetical protein